MAQKSRWRSQPLTEFGQLQVSLRRLDQVLNAQVAYTDEDVLPIITATHSLGSAALKWKDLFLSGALNAASMVLSGNATVTGTLSVTGAAVFSSTATIHGALTTSVGATIGGALSVSAGATIGGTLSASGEAQFGAGIRQSGSVVVRIESTFVGVPSGATGPGLELGYFTGSGQVLLQAYNRLTAAYVGMEFDALSFDWRPSGNSKMLLTSTDLKPTAAGGLTLGTSSLPWGEFFAQGDSQLVDLKASSGTAGPYIGFRNSAGTRQSFIQHDFSGGVFNIDVEANIPMIFYTNNTERWRIAAAGHLLAGTDNSWDIGASGATRPRSGFFGTNITLGGSLIFGAASGKIIPGATSLSLRNNADSVDNLLITDAGVLTTRQELRVIGETGGVASANTLTGTSDLTANSTGIGTILFKGATSRNSAGFIKIFIGTTAHYIPAFTAITG